MGLFKKRSTDPQEIARLRSDVAMMSARLEATDAAKAELVGKLDGIGARLEAAESTEQRLGEQVDGIVTRLTPMEPPSEPPPELAPAVDPAELAALRDAVEHVAKRIDEADQRITSISTELANQISELSGELEGLGANEPPTDQIVDELRDAQERLANEQARYQIAFRHDLAEIANRLKRP